MFSFGISAGLYDQKCISVGKKNQMQQFIMSDNCIMPIFLSVQR